ncbi:15464_t:CDS:2 [Funneliformis geosporum]|uniref:15464_t:CDS:1 n=1 Tax=Funneliformis geosporum TaxID=1117311 RepID=A0A9W4SSA5_9GLOM|nr:15464_t:CDS:2 [Funneliformis geosporum]
MVDSYNCLRLDDRRVFHVEVYEDDDKQKFFEFGNNKKVQFEKLKVGQLAELISLDVDKSKLNTEDDIRKLGGVPMEFEYDFINYIKDEPSRNKIHIVAVVATTTTAGPSQQGVSQEEKPLTMERIIETANIIGNKDKPVITMYDYIERTHIQEFIRKKIEINLKAFENESSRLNDYQGNQHLGGSGTGKTRHGYETINIIKDLIQIKDGSFRPIHIFVQIFPESFLIRFDERPQRDPSLGRYPRNPSHVNSIGHYLALAIASYYFTKNYRQESLQYFKELVKSSTFDLITVLQAIQQSCSIDSQQPLLILLQLDEYQRCTGTAPIKLREYDNTGHLSVTDYNVYDIHMSPMDIENSLNFMDSCASELLRMKGPFDSVEQVKEIWKVLVDWAKQKFRLIIEKIDNTRYKAKAPLVLIASLVSHLELGFFDDIILDPFNRLDEESFPKFILHMHLITYRLADFIGVRQMTIEEIYFGCLLASNEKDYDDPKNPYTWNQLIDRKEVSVIADAKNDKKENVDVTTGRFIVLVVGVYKFSSATESGVPVHKPFTLEEFKKELKKATKGCECFIVMTIKNFLDEVSNLPSRVSGDLTT